MTPKNGFTLNGFTLNGFTLNGFTLIELLVVIAMGAILFGLGIARYINFQESRILSLEAERIKVGLREIRNKAILGEKPADCISLDGYRIEKTGNNITGQAVCNGSEFGIQIILETNPRISLSAVSGFPFDFKTHSGALNGNEATVTLLLGTRTMSLVINSGGEINVSAQE